MKRTRFALLALSPQDFQESFWPRKKQGLTRLEILIILFILGILLALFVQHLTTDPERRLALEARDFLSDIRLGQVNLKNMYNHPKWLDAVSYYKGEMRNVGWDMLGLKPLPKGTPFRYECKASPGACTARRLGAQGNPKVGGTITIDLETSNIRCGAPYRTVKGTADSTLCG